MPFIYPLIVCYARWLFTCTLVVTGCLRVFARLPLVATPTFPVGYVVITFTVDFVAFTLRVFLRLRLRIDVDFAITDVTTFCHTRLFVVTRLLPRVLPRGCPLVVLI